MYKFWDWSCHLLKYFWVITCCSFCYRTVNIFWKSKPAVLLLIWIMSLFTQRFYEVHGSASVIWHHHHGLNYCFKNSCKVLLRKSVLDECTIQSEKYIDSVVSWCLFVTELKHSEIRLSFQHLLLWPKVHSLYLGGENQELWCTAQLWQ